MRRRDLLRSGAAGALAALPIGRPIGGVIAHGAIAARPVPTPDQLAWQQRELAMFLHLGVNTFTDREWGDGTESPAIFDPARLDATQWVRAARTGGFRTVILTAKHHDGFCLWPSRLTDHSVRASPWRGGGGDVVAELAAAARSEGLGLGLYLSPWDRHAPSYGQGERYNDFYCGQLTELLSGYGPVAEVWFDGANGEGPNGRRQTYDWPRIHRIVRTLQPHALIFSDAGPDIRWCGNERGEAGDPNWCTVDPAAVPYPGADGPGITDALQHGDPAGSVWRPAEADVSIRPGWFWHPAEDERVRSTDDLLELYLSSVGRNANLLLNVPPTTSGLLHDSDVRRLAEFGARRSALLATDLAADARRTGDPVRRIMTLALPAVRTFDLISLGEAIEHGQAVAGYAVECRTRDGWRTVARGTTIGHRRLQQIASVAADRVRLTVTAAVGPVRLGRIGLYYGGESGR